MRRGLALVLLLALPAHASDGGLALPVISAHLRLTSDAGMDVGPGVYLPSPLARELAGELEARRANPPPPSPAAITIAFVLGVVVGGAVVVAAVHPWSP